MISRGLALRAMGIVAGAAAALFTTRLLGYLLYQVSPRDAGTSGWALLVVAGVSLGACLAPARRAMHTDPVRALRN